VPQRAGLAADAAAAEARAHVEALGLVGLDRGEETTARSKPRGKYSANSRPLTVILRFPGSRITRATDVLRLPVPR